MNETDAAILLATGSLFIVVVAVFGWHMQIRDLREHVTRLEADAEASGDGIAEIERRLAKVRKALREDGP